MAVNTQTASHVHVTAGRKVVNIFCIKKHYTKKLRIMTLIKKIKTNHTNTCNHPSFVIVSNLYLGTVTRTSINNTKIAAILMQLNTAGANAMPR